MGDRNKGSSYLNSAQYRTQKSRKNIRERQKNIKMQNSVNFTTNWNSFEVLYVLQFLFVGLHS